MSDVHADEWDDEFDDAPPDDASPDGAQTEEPKKTRNGERYRRTRLELAEARKQVKLLRAGVDPESPLGTIVMQHFTGEFTREAVNAYLEELGVSVGGGGPEITPELRASTHERRSLAENGVPDTGEGMPPRQVMMSTFEQAVAAGASEAEAQVIASQAHLAALAEQDPSLFDRGRREA